MSLFEISALDAVTTWLAARPSLVLLAIGLFACLESTFMVGLFVSSLFVVSLATTATVQGWSSLLGIVPVAFLGAVLGDHLGFWIGRTGGKRVDRWRRRPAQASTRRARALARAETLFERFGPFAILAGRFLPPVRSLVPFTAGLTGMATRRFVMLDLAACSLWALGLGAIVSGLELAFF